ncbi:MAG TPA: PucR family transcriptional regulator ligand-binding domain-containing protein [Pseudonocardia sp.]|jgi:purine catabolism regulator|nr:PucR family transcriptional regulator ligand-binding domain-containing protein [Pseudonocardia sp.]
MPPVVLTVRKVLALEVFTRTEAVVLAGEQHLDQPVRWVHAGEIPDIHRFLTGGEMLLTAGLGMGTTAEQQRSFVRRVARANAAVLVVELAGRAFTTMPTAVVDEAEALGLPLVGLRDEIPFVEASAQVHEILVELRTAELIAEEAAGHAFMDLLLDDRDYVALTEELARRTGHPVVLEDVTHQVVAYVGRTPAADAVVGDWGMHSRAMHEHHTRRHNPGQRQPVAAAGSFRNVVACARRAVVLRGETWGWLHLLHGPTPPTTAQQSTLDRAAAAVAITLLSERETGARSAKRQGALLNRLMLGEFSGEDFVARALALGRDLRDRPLAVVVAAQDGPAGTFTDADLAKLLHDAGHPALVGDLGEFSLAVVGLPRGTTDRQLADALAVRDLRGGVSKIVDVTGLPVAVRQARSAAAAAAARSLRSVVRFDDLGVLRLLVALADGPELASYVEDELGELLLHDAMTANPLLPTLRTFLSHNGNKAAAAQVLHIQRRTLYYRLERIGAILGRALDDSETQQRLQLAVRGHDLLQRRPSPHRA